MSHQVILLMHPTFGVFGILAAAWVFVDALNVNDANLKRIRTAAAVASVLMILAWITGGYFYVNFYGAEKAMILQGPWPFAHNFMMETKEHLFFVVLLLALYLPIAARDQLTTKGPKLVVLATSGLIVLTGIAIEGAGAIISMGVKVALLAGIH